MIIFQLHVGPRLFDIQRFVDSRQLSTIREPNFIPYGNGFGGIFWHGIFRAIMVGRLSLKIHGILGPIAIRKKTDFAYWFEIRKLGKIKK